MINISELFIRRPVMTTLVMFGFLLFGIVGYLGLPISDLPNVDFPTIQVSASLSGASPEIMSTTVASPLESQFSSIPGLSSMTSNNSLGRTQITLQFDLDRNIDSAAQDVQTAISQTTRQLPSSMLFPPSYRKVDPTASPIMYFALSSKNLLLSDVDDYAEDILGQQISMVDGVAQVDILGPQKYAVRIQVLPDVLANLNIPIENVITTIQQNNADVPTGSLNGLYQTTTLHVEGQLHNADAFRPLIVAYRNGKPVRLEQVAHVLDSVERDKSASWLNTERAIIISVQRQPGSNTIKVVENIKSKLAKLQQLLPSDATLTLVYDRSTSIRASVFDVQFTLLLSACLVVLVIFLFLRQLSATFIPAITLPISLITTFGIMWCLNFNIDNISLLGLTLAVGFVVDDAIVVLENIMRHIEEGESVFEATLEGTKEVGFTIVSMTISLIAVFIPVLFMGGLIGRIFHEFAITVSCAILISGIVSLTLTPMLASRILIKHEHHEPHGILLYFEKLFTQVTTFYTHSLNWILNHPRFTLSLFILSIILTILLSVTIPKGFIPAEDMGLIVGNTESAENISYPAMVELQQKAVAALLTNHAVENINSYVGGGNNNNTGRLMITLKPKNQRESIQKVILQFQKQVADIPNIKIYFQNPPPIRVGARSSKSLYQYTLQSTNLNDLMKWARLLENKMKSLPLLTNVNSDLEMQNPQLNINIDRDKAAALGVSILQIEKTLSNAYGGQQISTINASTTQYSVIFEVAPQFQQTKQNLDYIYIANNVGKLIQLSAFANIVPSVGPLSINHQNQFPSVTISFDTPAGTSLSDAIAAINLAEKELALPESISGNFQGNAQVFQQSQSGILGLLLIAVLVVYIVLGILYESFIHPLTILSGLPAAAFGALLTLRIFNCELDIYALIGMIMLIGIVKKNAIMMIDFALDAQRNKQFEPRKAIYHACIVRFRPIMMTTLVALVGTLPIALSLGSQGVGRQHLGLAVVGGLLTSQILTLYITPVIYLYLENLAFWQNK